MAMAVAGWLAVDRSRRPAGCMAWPGRSEGARRRDRSPKHLSARLQLCLHRCVRVALLRQCLNVAAMTTSNSKAAKAVPAKAGGVHLATFRKWNVGDAYDVDVAVVDDRETVTRIWCKTCRRHAIRICQDERLRGQAKNDCLSFAAGSTNVVKCAVMRHLTSQVSIGLRFYRAMLCICGTSHGPVSVRPSVCPSQVGPPFLVLRGHRQ